MTGDPRRLRRLRSTPALRRLVSETRLSPDRFVLNASSPGTLVVRVRASTHWALRGEGCVEATDDGWTQVRVDVPGVVEVVQALRGTPCAG